MPAFRIMPFARAWILRKCGPTSFDFICQGWPAPSRVFATDLKCFLRGQYPVTYLNVLNSTRLYASMAHQNGGFRPFTHHFGQTRAKMRFVDHHLAHAISAYSYSGFRQCRRRRDGRARRLGSQLDLVRPRRASRSRAHDSVAEFAGAFLRAVHAVPRIRSQ